MPFAEPFRSDRPLGFYDPLTEITKSLSVASNRISESGKYPTPELLNKLPNLRPSRAWYGVKEDTKSAAKIAANATLAAAPKSPTSASGPSTKGSGSFFSGFMAAARKILSPAPSAAVLSSYDDEEPYLPAPRIYLGRKPEPS
jgi:hypothetical protein